MTTGGRAGAQLRTIGWLDAVLTEQGLDYWLFGGWAVDFHAGRVTRDHADIDVAVWATDLDRIRATLETERWVHTPEPDENGYIGYECQGVRLELAFLARDEAGTVYTPLAEGRGDWPASSFRDDRAELGGVSALVVSLTSLIEDKSGTRGETVAAEKDLADVALLTSLHRGA